MVVAEVAELGGVADVDDAKGFVFADAEGDFAVAASQVVKVQGGGGGSVENLFQDVSEDLGGGKGALPMITIFGWRICDYAVGFGPIG